MKLILTVSVAAFLCYSAVAESFLLKGLTEYRDISKNELQRIKSENVNLSELMSLFIAKSNPDTKVSLKRLKPDSGNTRYFSLSHTNHFELGKGIYKFETLQCDILLGELIEERLFIYSTPVITVPASHSSVYRPRRLFILCYPPKTFVSIRGRMIDVCGNCISGLDVTCQPLNRTEWAVHEYMETKTDHNGCFMFEGLPPASMDAVVHLLLYGKGNRNNFGKTSVLNARIFPAENPALFKDIKLVSSANLLPIIELATCMRNRMPIKMLKRSIDMNTVVNKFPVSTNNVIYVGDIVLPDRKQQAKD